MSRTRLPIAIAACFAMAATALAEAPATAPAKQTIRVKTAEEFVKAIGPDRVLELEEGDYVLTDVEDRKMQHVLWTKEFDGKNLFIRNVKNLRIVGIGKNASHLVVRPSYVYTLGLKDCEGVTLENLKLGHAPEKGACTAGVLAVQSSKNVTLKKCDLYGCGTEGLTLEKSQDITVEESSIRECSYGILTANDCANVTFTRVRLHDNEQFWGIRITDSEKFSFTDCTIENNRTDDESPLITTTSSSTITVKNCIIKNNRAPSLTDPNTKAVSLQDNTVEGNRFEKRRN